MPMLTRRTTEPAALLVWSVLSTRWPVSADLIAMSAVSASRISPTMITSGSWRRIDRSALANVSPMSAFTLTWLMPPRLNSTGSSTVTMFFWGLSIIFSSA